MPLLTDCDIRKIVCSNKIWKNKHNTIHIYPFNEDCVTPVGYDLRVGEEITSKKGLTTLKENESITIKPGDTALVETLEKLGMPKSRKLSGLIVSKVSKVSIGLSHISTSVDPDWDGRLLIAVHNHSKKSIDLKYGDSICTVIFLENRSPSNKECEKPAGRADILKEHFATELKKKKKIDIFKNWLPSGIFLISTIIGYLLFRNDTQMFTLVVAIGGTLSQIIIANNNS